MRRLTDAVWLSWRQRAEYEKKQARKTDSDLSAEISELVGYDIGRAQVNHWFRGRRQPSIEEFIALCASLGADPGYILLNVRVAYQPLTEGSQAALAMHERGASPKYLAKQAKRLRQSQKPRKAKTTV